MAKVLTVINQKGGVSKTTTTEAIGVGLAVLHGKRVLFIDTDPQSNLSFSLKANTLNVISSNEVLQTPALAPMAVQAITPNIHVIPASPALANAEKTLTEIGREYRLKEAIDVLKPNYDFILIDTPPTLSVLTANALTAADGCIIPTLADMYSLNGIEMLYGTISAVRQYANPKLAIEGILLSKFNKRTVISQEVAKALASAAESIGTKLFKTTIRECNPIREAQLQRRSIYDYAPKSNAVADYSKLIDELLASGE